MRFIGREEELRTLEAIYRRDGFQMLILCGRRRVGKTTLLNRFAEGKNALFYTGIESKDDENLREMGRAVFAHYSLENAGINFRSWGDLLAYITSASKRSVADRKELIILDEYPFMADSAPELNALLQREIDREWLKLNLMLVLCGSSAAFMEDAVLGEGAPLYGWRTSRINLQPFDYLTSAEFVPSYTEEEKALVYGLTGGIPRYLCLFEDAVPLEETVLAQFFDMSGFLYEEPKNLLRREFRDISLYYAIISAIAFGHVQISEIAGKTGFDTAKVAQALRKLETVGIVRKDSPILNERNRKLNQYVLQDGMFRFWFRFVSRGIGQIERNHGEAYYRAAVRPFLREFMGPCFEQICREYVMHRGVAGDVGNGGTRTGKWRGGDPLKRCPADIDVVGISETDRVAVIGECKFRDETAGMAELAALRDRARLIAPYAVVRYLLFSLSGFTSGVAAAAEKDPEIGLVTMEELYRG